MLVLGVFLQQSAGWLDYIIEVVYLTDCILMTVFLSEVGF